ncbi:MAG TPA: hypothetical protein VFY29_19680 [Terriglobia bacterium]|nr:hypothetical protein [Terriglobia bacterium]
MRKECRPLVIVVLGALLMGSAGEARPPQTRALWVDYDFKDIPEPKVRPGGFYTEFFQSEFSGSWQRSTDIPRLVRSITGKPEQASNVNAWDEVPDSSWFTNRHALRPMNVDELARGPNRGAPPDFSQATITKTKHGGVTPGLQITDRNGQAYLIKFDHRDYPELQSGAEVISTKILFAAGYNVPENYIAIVDPDRLEIAAGLEVGQGSSRRPFTRQDLSLMLDSAARRPDGTYRVLASRILSGKPKGPFSFTGMRGDDPNDWIPHERRRELRGLRVIASWINHWDIKEDNTLDMYVEEGGRRFLRHYLLDFGCTLGGSDRPTDAYHGREYAFDQGNILKEIVTLGIYQTPAEQKTSVVDPSVGLFSADDFDPGSWIPSFHTAPFADMTREDAFWATRIVLSFSEADLRAIVDTAEYSDPDAGNFIFLTLLRRQRMLAAYWLGRVNPIAYFAVEPRADGVSVTFVDLMARLNGGSAEYRYVLTAADRSCGVNPESFVTTGASRVPLGTCVAGETCIHISTHSGPATRPVTVCVRDRGGGNYRIERIERL